MHAHLPTHIVDVTESDFDVQVVARSHQVPVLVDIGADWCAPCRVLAPRLEKLVRAHAGAWILARVDADENMRIAGRHKVRGFPTVIAYVRGEEVSRFHGMQADHVLRPFVDDVLARFAAGHPA